MATSSLFQLHKPANPSPLANATTASSSVFGQPNSANTSAAPTQQSAFGSSLFGGSTFGANAGTQQQQQQQQTQPTQQQQHQQLGQQQQQQQQQTASGLNSSIMSGSLFQLAHSSLQPHQKSIPEQIHLITEKWDPNNPECLFKHYFYNKVDESRVPFYAPGRSENAKEWEDALQKKPAAGFMPVLAAGFAAVGDRLKIQRKAIGEYNARLHEINTCLDAILGKHDLEWTVRATKARRKHDELRRRTMVLARKVQVLRNRGYALSSDEDELRVKLEGLDRTVRDPAVGARLEDLWSRLIMLRDYARSLQAEMTKRGLGEGEGLSEEVEVKAKKIVEDYEKQIVHLRKEVDIIKADLEEWEKEHGSIPLK